MLEFAVFVGFGEGAGLPGTSVEGNAHDDSGGGNRGKCIGKNGLAPVEGSDGPGGASAVVFIVGHDDDTVSDPPDERVVIGISWVLLFMLFPACHNGDTEDLITWKRLFELDEKVEEGSSVAVGNTLEVDLNAVIGLALIDNIFDDALAEREVGIEVVVIEVGIPGSGDDEMSACVGRGVGEIGRRF